MTQPIRISVTMDSDTFKSFVSFDLFHHRKAWRRPAVFTTILLVSAIICLNQMGSVPDAWKLSVVLAVIALGLPLAVSTLLSSCAGVLNNGLLARYGDTAVAAMGVSGKASMLAVMIAMGICIGIQPAISFNFGRGDAKRALEISRKTAALAFAVSALLGGACYMARDGFMAAFTSDAAVIELGRVMLAISLTACPLAGAYQACTAFLQATGKASYAIALSVLRQGALYVPCMYIMNGAAGLNGLMYTGAVTDVLAFAIALAMCIGWKRRILRGELGEEGTTAAKS